MANLLEDWDPLKCNSNMTEYGSQALKRIKRDVAALTNEPPSGILVYVDDDDFTLIHAIILGVEGTPYHGGFFYFVVKCTPDYPLKPPKVRLLTTGNGEVRFNPNFYESGKVCLSILGTWYGPCWLPSCTLESILVSIQSIMNEAPLLNEPDLKLEEGSNAVEDYNLYVETETLNVAVAGMLQSTHMKIPDVLLMQIRHHFVENYNNYEQLAHKNASVSRKMLKVPFYNIRRKSVSLSIVQQFRIMLGWYQN